MAYNIALNYLRDKYGYTRDRYTATFENKLHQAGTIQKKRKLIGESTDDDYVLRINKEKIPLDRSFDHQVLVLIDQYYHGASPKKELENLMKSIGLM
jgi:hypothetical protein